MILQSPPLLCQSVSEGLQSLTVTTGTEAVRFHRDKHGEGHVADFSAQFPNL